MVHLSCSAVLAWRVQRQLLLARAPAAGLLDVVARIAGSHAQVRSSAELTLWARIDGLASDAVERAVWRDRTLVKTWTMRGTLHLLPSSELGLWVAALSALPPRHHVPSWLRHHGLERAEADAMLAAIPEALDDGPLTREQLADRVASLVSSSELAEKLRGGFGDLLKPAAFRGDLCFAPSSGAKVRFTRPDKWLGPQAAVAPEAAVAHVTRRFLGAYGPATREHFARWFGMSSAPLAGRWINGLGSEVVQVSVEGASAWMLASDVEAAVSARPSGVVRLLPAFDQYVVAAPRGAEAILPGEHRARVYRPQGWLSPVVLIDGRMTGVWSHERRGARVAVRLETWERPSSGVRRAVESEAARLAAILGGEPDVAWD